MRLRDEGELGVDTESFGFFESSCEQEYLILIEDDDFVDVIEEDMHPFYFSD